MNKITFVILFVIVAISTTIFSISYYQRSLTEKPVTPEQITEVATPLFIGCKEQRDYLKTDDLLYIACDGGVLGVDPTSNKIIETLTMADGLSNEFITSLVKYKDYLYIGSQDGITQYNLVTNKAKIINTSSGLSNGANIKLLLDENTLWVATFDGLDSINLETLKITKHKKDINPELTTLNTTAIAKGGNFIYASILGSDKSTGFIAKLNKSTNTWENFEAGDFTSSPTAGLNVNDFYVTEDSAYAFEMFNTGQDFDKTLADVLENKTVWKQKFDDDKWVSVTEDDKEILNMAYDSKNRPYVKFANDATANKLWHVVNSKIIAGGGPDLQSNTLIELDHKSLAKKFIPSKIDDASIIFFEPIEYTNLSVVIYQTCGQGCLKPRLYLHNYVTDALDEVSIPIESPEGLTGYGFVSSFDTQELVLSIVDTVSLEEHKFKLDTLAKQLTKLSSTKLSKLPELQHPIKASSNVYDFNSRFTLSRRLVTTTTKEDAQKLGITYTSDDELIKLQYKGKEYTLRMLPKRYSPFADWEHTIEVRKLQLDQNVLWVSTDRGVVRIDTNTGVTTLFGPKDGLISPNVKDFIFVDGKLITTYNGISVVE